MDTAESLLAIMRRVVAQHLADSRASGNPTAAALAESLATELDAAGIPVDLDAATARTTSPKGERTARRGES